MTHSNTSKIELDRCSHILSLWHRLEMRLRPRSVQKAIKSTRNPEASIFEVGTVAYHGDCRLPCRLPEPWCLAVADRLTALKKSSKPSTNCFSNSLFHQYYEQHLVCACVQSFGMAEQSAYLGHGQTYARLAVPAGMV